METIIYEQILINQPCKEQQHIHLRATVHCHPSNVELLAGAESAVKCVYMDARCQSCNSLDVSRFEMDESFEHKCNQCGEVWLRFMDNGERMFMSEHWAA